MKGIIISPVAARYVVSKELIFLVIGSMFDDWMYRFKLNLKTFQ